MAVTNIPIDKNKHFGYKFDGRSNIIIENGVKEYLGDRDLSIEIVITTGNDTNVNQSFFRTSHNARSLMMQISINNISFLYGGYPTLLYNNILPNTQYHIIFTYNSLNKERTLYVNGKFIDSKIGGFLFDNINNIHVGSSNINVEYFDGYVHHIRIFNMILDQNYINTLWNNGKWNEVELSRLDYGIIHDRVDTFTTDVKGFKLYETSSNIPLSYLKGDGFLTFPSSELANSYKGGIFKQLEIPIPKYTNKNYYLNVEYKATINNEFFIGGSSGNTHYFIGNNNSLTLKKQIYNFKPESRYNVQLNTFGIYKKFTDTTPGTISLKSFEVGSLGCVLELLPDNAYHDKWLDTARGWDVKLDKRTDTNNKLMLNNDFKTITNLTDIINKPDFDGQYTILNNIVYTGINGEWKKC